MNDTQLQIESVIQDILNTFRGGDPEGALKAADKAREQFPENADIYHVTSRILEAGGAIALAIEMMENAAQKPDANPSYWLDLGALLTQAGRNEDAIDAYRKNIEISDAPNPGRDALSKLYEHLGDTENAIALLYDALDDAQGDKVKTIVRLNELGIRLHGMCKYAEAIDVLNRALEIDTAMPEVNYNIGNVYMDIGRHDKAIKHYQITLDSRHDFPDPHLHMAFAYLLQGNLKRGWREMEWRWKIPVFAKTALSTPRWDGKKIDGTILMLSEQGLGDSVHFVRYAEMVAKLCDNVVVYCPQSLERLMKSVPGVSEVATWNEPIPHHDVYVPMMSLPYAFKTEMDTIPANVPYLFAQADDMKAWKKKLAHLKGPKIGLVWSGNPANQRERIRSIPAAAVMEMVNSCEADFICMTKDRPSGIDHWPDNLHHFGDEFGDVADAAALVENLDLVLSIDTLMTHLAGAMNKDLWILLAPAADWRYLLDREDSPWYPSAHIKRRTNDEDWSTFMARVGRDLKARFNDV